MILPKIEINKILYATDLSDTSIHALAYAVHLANIHGAGITILHVLFEAEEREARIAPLIGEDRWKEIKQRLYSEAREKLIGKRRDNAAMQEALETFTEKVKAGAGGEAFVTDEIIIDGGDPAERILETAEDKNCDLIVLGTHGHGAIKDLFIGSTARKVVRESKIPVLVVRLPKQ